MRSKKNSTQERDDLAIIYGKRFVSTSAARWCVQLRTLVLLNTIYHAFYSLFFYAKVYLCTVLSVFLTKKNIVMCEWEHLCIRIKNSNVTLLLSSILIKSHTALIYLPLFFSKLHFREEILHSKKKCNLNVIFGYYTLKPINIELRRPSFFGQ